MAAMVGQIAGISHISNTGDTGDGPSAVGNGGTDLKSSHKLGCFEQTTSEVKKKDIPNATIANPISAYDQHQKRYTVLDNHLEYERDLRQFVPERTWNMAIGALHMELLIVFYCHILYSN